MAPFNVLILDHRSFWLSPSPPANSSIPKKTLKSILSSDIWHDYQRGRYTEDECYHQIAEHFAVSASDLAATFSDIRAAVTTNTDFSTWIAQYAHEGLAIYAMSNLTAAEYEDYHQRAHELDDMLHHVFASTHVRKRKPDIGFYRYVLRAVRARPEDVIFADDDQDSILAARSLGMTAIQLTSMPEFRRQLRNLLEDPVQRGTEFLESNAGKLDSTTNTGHTIKDNFTQLLILESTHKRDLIYLHQHERTWNYFIGKPLLTTDSYPDDLDTTAAALTVLKPKDKALVHSMLDEILEYCSEDGIVYTYYDHSRPRTDPIVCVNVLLLFYEHGRGHQLPATLQWVKDVLHYRAYMDGTRYYPTPEAFLYFLARLVDSAGDSQLRESLMPELIVRIRERSGTPGDALCLAMRLLAGSYVGVYNATDLATLKSLQEEDGGWEASCVYRYGSTGISIGNRGLATALAIEAISKQQMMSNSEAANGVGRKRHDSLNDCDSTEDDAKSHDMVNGSNGVHT